MDQEAEKIRSYFVGTLPPAEAEEIELRLISDAEFEATVIAVEGELVEDHLDDMLSGDEARNFRENYLHTDERAKNIEAVALLRKYAKIKALRAAPAGLSAPADGSILDKIRHLFSSIPAVAYAAGVLLIIGTTAAYMWLGRGTASERLQTEYAALNRGDLSDVNKFRSLPLISAVPGSVRGSDPKIKLNVEGSAFVRLALLDFKDHSIFNVSLRRGETVLLKLDDLRVYGTGNDREIRLLLPAKLLEKGTYQITAAPVSAPDSAVVYSFSVE